MNARMMKRHALILGLSALAGLSQVSAEPPAIISQVTPGTVSYQGRVQTAGGTNYPDGIYTVEFRLYDDATAGNLLWGASYKPYLNNGFFSVILGQTSVGEVALTTNAVADLWKAVWIDPLSANPNRYLGITVAEQGGVAIPGAQESFPRQQFLASPFAIQAQFAQQASGDFQVPSSGKVQFSGGNGTIDSDGGTVSVQDNLNVTGTLDVDTSITLGPSALMLTQLPWLGEEYIWSPTNLATAGRIIGNSILSYGDISLYNGLNVIGGGASVSGGSTLSDGVTINGGLSVTSINASANSGLLMVYDRLKVQSDTHVGGQFYVGSSTAYKPFMIRSYNANFTKIGHVDTGVSTNDYAAMVVGFDPGQYDILENTSEHHLDAMATPDGFGGFWRVRLEKPSSDLSTWTVHVLFIRREMADDQRTSFGS